MFKESVRACALCEFKPPRHMLMYFLEHEKVYVCLECHRYFCDGIEKRKDFVEHYGHPLEHDELSAILFGETK